MNLIEVDNLECEELKIYASLRDNAFDKNNSFVADSPKVVNMVLEADIEVKSILATREYYDEYAELLKGKNIPLMYVAERKLMESIIGHRLHHNVMMHGVRPALTPLEKLDDQIIMLDSVSSAENVGSIARSSAALGVNSYLLPAQAPHPYGRRALRVSMGYVSKLNVNLYDDIFITLQRLKENGYKIFAAEVTENSTLLMDVKVPKKWVLLMGHEGKGLSAEILAACDEAVEIEMVEGIKSFNVGVAASLLMYRFKNSSHGI